MPKTPIAATCEVELPFEMLWLSVTVGKDGATSLRLEGKYEDIWVHTDSPDELRRILQTALKLLDEAVAERQRRKS